MKKRSLFLVIIVIVIGGAGCAPLDPPVRDVEPERFEIFPSKLPDTSERTSRRTQTITFDFERNIGHIRREDWGNIIIYLEIIPNDTRNEAANNVVGNYFALVNGIPRIIPRPIGHLNTYRTNLRPGNARVSVTYTASDISGIYSIVAEAFHNHGSITTKVSTATVRIPGLAMVPQTFSATIWYTDPFGRRQQEERQLWNVIGQTIFHQRNNYLQSNAMNALLPLSAFYIREHRETLRNWSMLRLNNMSLPWGGMFWIGYVRATDLTINRRDGGGNNYTITYRANVDNRIYAPPHVTHRHGVNIDISRNDGFGNRIDELILRDAARVAGFAVLTKDTHFHLKYTNRGVIDYFPIFVW